MKQPVCHVILLRCSSCKRRFQTRANDEDQYKCPHCGEMKEYQAVRMFKPIGPTENK